MKIFQKALFNIILWATPPVAALGWQLSCMGDSILETAGGAAMGALRGLAGLENESEAA